MREIGLITLYFFIFFVIALIWDRIWTIGKQKYFKKYIKYSYGTMEHYTKGKRINKENIGSYFLNIKDNEDFVIDNITWNDLNGDEVYQMLSNVQSSLGKEVLYKMLRVPLFSTKKLKDREEILKYLKENPDKRFELQYLIRCFLGKNDTATVSKYFKKEENYNESKKLKIHLTLRWVAIILLVSGVCLLNPALIILFSIIANINGFICSMAKQNKEFKLDDYSYLIAIIKSAFKLKALEIEEINRKYEEIESDLSAFKKIKSGIIGDLISATGGDTRIVRAILSNVFLIDIIDFERVSEAIFEDTDRIRRLYDYVGEIDALIGVASFRETLEYFSNPEFIDERRLSFEDIYNPVLKNPIVNSFSEDKSVLLTGSNASGKSTFLRTVGVNIILAQSFNMVLARKYRSPMFRIFSSMALADNILGGESYYMIEIKSLKRILNSIDKEDYPIFCIVDEILRGTNTAERIAASSEVLKYMVRSENIFCMAATHDIEITYMLENIFDNYSFEEKVINNDITFDYKIKKGRAKTRNAIKILEVMGYDREIIVNAEEKAEKFILNNKWKTESL